MLSATTRWLFLLHAVGKIYQLAGWAFSAKEAAVHIDSGKRVDGIASSIYDAGMDEAVDTTIVCPACRTYVKNAAADDSEYCTRDAEKRQAPQARVYRGVHLCHRRFHHLRGLGA